MRIACLPEVDHGHLRLPIDSKSLVLIIIPPFGKASCYGLCVRGIVIPSKSYDSSGRARWAQRYCACSHWPRDPFLISALTGAIWETQTYCSHRFLPFYHYRLRDKNQVSIVLRPSLLYGWSSSSFGRKFEGGRSVQSKNKWVPNRWICVIKRCWFCILGHFCCWYWFKQIRLAVRIKSNLSDSLFFKSLILDTNTDPGYWEIPLRRGVRRVCAGGPVCGRIPQLAQIPRILLSFPSLTLRHPHFPLKCLLYELDVLLIHHLRS